jgi:nucleotide-binding universal stress UspA family protein
MTRILLAVDDSPGGVRAAREAVRLASAMDAHLRAVTVMPEPAGGVAGTSRAAEVGPGDSAAVLDFVLEIAAREQLAVETLVLSGQPARVVLDQARAWPADLIVVGRSGRHHIGEHYVGADVKHILEFSESPVVVVPCD